MEVTPHVNWGFARRIAGRGMGDLPQSTRPELATMVASLRLAAERAGELAVEFGGADARPASRVVVTDRRTWVTAATRMGERVLASLPTQERRPGVRRSATGLGYGLGAGVAMSLVARRLLGQFDPFADEPTLFLLAPNILELERRRHLCPEDFRLWVAIHEQAHAVQFSAAPWLRDYLMERLLEVVQDDPGLGEGLLGALEGRGAQAFWASRLGQRALEEITATMTLLEGHADHVADRAGAVHIPTVRTLRRAFARGTGTHWLARAIPTLDKGAQYRDGLAFCNQVAARVGTHGLARAFAEPATLPTLEEIRTPASWVERIHGPA